MLILHNRILSLDPNLMCFYVYRCGSCTWSAAKSSTMASAVHGLSQTFSPTSAGLSLVGASKQSASGPERQEIDSKPIAAASAAITSGFLQPPSSKAPRPQRQLLRQWSAPRRFR
jgi:hypothetical protein